MRKPQGGILSRTIWVAVLLIAAAGILYVIGMASLYEACEDRLQGGGTDGAQLWPLGTQCDYTPARGKQFSVFVEPEPGWVDWAIPVLLLTSLAVLAAGFVASFRDLRRNSADSI